MSPAKFSSGSWTRLLPPCLLISPSLTSSASLKCQINNQWGKQTQLFSWWYRLALSTPRCSSSGLLKINLYLRYWDTPLGRRLSYCLPSPENNSKVNHVSKVSVSCSQAHNHDSLQSQGSPSIYYDLLEKLSWWLTGKPFLGLHMFCMRWKLSNIMRMWHESLPFKNV